MFSYWAGVWQSHAAKRGEIRFNGIALSLSGAALWHSLRRRWASPARDSREPALSAVEWAAVATWDCTDQSYHFFALDSRGELVQNGITSQPALQLVPAKVIFVCILVAACKSSDPVDLHKSLSPRRPAICGRLLFRSAPRRGTYQSPETRRRTGDFMSSIRK